MTTNARPLRIFLVKPYQTCTNFLVIPPLGLLSIVSCLRERLGDRVEIRFLDAKLKKMNPEAFAADLAWADVVGISALNFEADASAAIAAATKALGAEKIVALGGPYAHRREIEILTAQPNFDWVFGGEADRSFPDAVERLLDGGKFDGTIKGMHCREPETGRIVSAPGNDFITDLDALPFPAWDLVEWDEYAGEQTMHVYIKGKRYAPLFTSRGCPYQCSYCHDIFTKKYRWQSAERVLAEIDLLVTKYGVDEFQIIDDIFNLHKPRVKAIMNGVVSKYGAGKLNFCFPNGLRGDILDRELIRTLKDGGAYQITIAVETVTPRLQGLIEKNLNIPKVADFITFCHDEGIAVKGFFMLGFPTESPAELWNTIRFAWKSKLTFASFFTVVPQPGTPLHALAKQENAETLARLRDNGYYMNNSWYTMTYGYPLSLVTRLAYLGFYLKPGRFFRILRILPMSAIQRGVDAWIAVLFSVDMVSLRSRLRGFFRRKPGAASADA